MGIEELKKINCLSIENIETALRSIFSETAEMKPSAGEIISTLLRVVEARIPKEDKPDLVGVFIEPEPTEFKKVTEWKSPTYTETTLSTLPNPATETTLKSIDDTLKQILQTLKNQ